MIDKNQLDFNGHYKREGHVIPGQTETILPTITTKFCNG